MKELDSKLMFGNSLRTIRINRHLTIREFAQLTEYSPVYICDLENGNRKPTLEMLNTFNDKLCLTKEEYKSLQKGYLFAHPESVIPLEVMCYILENNLIEALQTLEIIDKKGTKIKELVK